jgi:hypothetical protein
LRAVKTVLGIAGDYMARMVRNHPVEVSLIFCPILVGLVLPILIRKESRTAPVWRTSGFLGLALVLIGSALAGVFSGTSFWRSKQPILTVQPGWSTVESVWAPVDLTSGSTGVNAKPTPIPTP